MYNNNYTLINKKNHLHNPFPNMLLFKQNLKTIESTSVLMPGLVSCCEFIPSRWWGRPAAWSESQSCAYHQNCTFISVSFFYLFFSKRGLLSGIVLERTSHCCNVKRLAGVSLWSPVSRMTLILPHCHGWASPHRQTGRLPRYLVFWICEPSFP